jgi:hypothetical protein
MQRLRDRDDATSIRRSHISRLDQVQLKYFYQHIARKARSTHVHHTDTSVWSAR